VADNTFASPVIHRPLESGLILVHSATKYLNGHSDVVAGLAVVGDNKVLADKLGYLQNAVGGVLDPFSSFLTLRGIRTLALRWKSTAPTRWRLRNGWSSTLRSKSVLSGTGIASAVSLARTQMALPGGMISVVVKGDAQRAQR
jgi:cystathionine gamma-lyase